MSTDSSPTKPDILKYLARLGPHLDPLTFRIFKEGSGEDIPIVSSDLGYLLQLLVSVQRPKTIVEVGTAIGYSTLFMARGLKEFGPRGAHLHTIDIDADRQRRAAEALEQDGTRRLVKFHLGPGLDVLRRWPGPIDFLFLDAIKEEYRQYVEFALPHMKAGGLIVADNVLWSGRVASRRRPDSATRALQEFNKYIVSHPRIFGQVLPIGDGVALGILRANAS